MNPYRIASIGVVTTFFVSVCVTVLLPIVLFNPRSEGTQNNYSVSQVGDPGRGRQLYIREGCVYCHSQYTRLQDRGMGPLTKAGDFNPETPNQLGTARTGPDISNEGGRYPDGWQRAHLINPRALKPGSIMPSFSFLSNRDLDDLVAYIQTLGSGRPNHERYAAPEEYLRFLKRKKVDVESSRSVQMGKGLYIQDCSGCHGLRGRGNGPASIQLATKPPDFQQGRFNDYSDVYWFYKVSEGNPGSAMPRFMEALSEEERWYLVAYLKTLRDPSAKDPLIESRMMLPVEMRHTHQHWEPTVSDE